MNKIFTFSMLAFFLLLISCKKGISANDPQLEQYFESNVLNKNFIVSLAIDNNTDLTSNYSNYIFVLLKSDYYHGPLKGSKNGVEIIGSWSSNSDYSKLIITFPSPPAELSFLSRSWRFTSKSFPTLKLAPWGSNDPIQLNMTRL